MNNLYKNIFSYLMFFLLMVRLGGEAKAQEQIHLFPDKSFAVSGDTVWFNIFIYSNESVEHSEVVHVQLDDLKNNHVSKVSVLCNGNYGKGYIYIPDSLSTGIYVLKPFSLAQKNKGIEVINQRFLSVYNRFNTEVNTINFPQENDSKTFETNNDITLTTNKNEYVKGDKIDFKIEIPSDKLEEYDKVFITAGLADPLSEEFLNEWKPSDILEKTEMPISLTEMNGILIAGKVLSIETGNPVSNAIVLLSIPDSIPFFDYCISDESGMFYYYLRNAIGTADLVFQTLTNEEEECEIQLLDSYVDANGNEEREKILSFEEKLFAENSIKTAYYKILFNGYSITSSDYFSMPLQFDYPFYGEPTESFFPDLYFDLPNFQEIAREILQGVQYRNRKDKITIRLLDKGEDAIFTQEPLRLLDGIPVFNNEVFKPMGTESIRKVDVVLFKRFYGDLTFNGILSVYTKNRSLDWVDNDSRISHIKYSCLQEERKYEFANGRVQNTNVPNLNKVFYRNSPNEIKSQNEYSFYTSDIKGNVAIRVVLIDKKNQISYFHKIIKVE